MIGVDNDTDSENDKLPTLELLCDQAKKLICENYELKQKLQKKNKSFLTDTSFFEGLGIEVQGKERAKSATSQRGSLFNSK